MPVEKSLTSLFAQALEKADDDGEAAIRVVAISGFYYAALAAKLIKKGATVYQYLKASKIAESLVKMRTLTLERKSYPYPDPNPQPCP